MTLSFKITQTEKLCYKNIKLCTMYTSKISIYTKFHFIKKFRKIVTFCPEIKNVCCKVLHFTISQLFCFTQKILSNIKFDNKNFCLEIKNSGYYIMNLEISQPFVVKCTFCNEISNFIKSQFLSYINIYLLN